MAIEGFFFAINDFRVQLTDVWIKNTMKYGAIDPIARQITILEHNTLLFKQKSLSFNSSFA